MREIPVAKSDTRTAIVMRKAFEAFVTQDACEIDNPETIMAIVYLKDVSAPTNSGRSKQTIQLVIARSVAWP